MSTDRNKELDKARTRDLIVNPSRPKYTGGENWLGHGSRGGRDAIIDDLLLDGATMERLLQERGTEASIRSHFGHLRIEHGLPVTRDQDGKYKFDRDHLSVITPTPGQVHASLFAEDAAAADSPEPNGYTLQGLDQRELVHREIRARRGQRQFRDALRERYQNRCVVTDCKIVAILEAAHINPYRGENDNHPANGLLLRADIHTLFDLDLLGVEPTQLRVELHPTLLGEYGHLAGILIRCPESKRPSRDALELRYKLFCLRREQPA